jgi:hypothetical protein
MEDTVELFTLVLADGTLAPNCKGSLLESRTRVVSERISLACAREILASEVETEISVRAEGLEVRLGAHPPCLRVGRDESDALEHRGRLQGGKTP